MRLDKGNILKPTPGLYLIPIKSYKQKRTLTSWRHYLQMQIQMFIQRPHYIDYGGHVIQVAYTVTR